MLFNRGPDGTHECFESFESFFPKKDIEFIYYDQLGCGNSDNSEDILLLNLHRFIEEVIKVRKALHLDKDNFYLLEHSWGVILVIQYTLQYQQNLKGLNISHIVSSCLDFGKYANDVLAKQMAQEVLAEVRAIKAKKILQIHAS